MDFGGDVVGFGEHGALDPFIFFKEAGFGDGLFDEIIVPLLVGVEFADFAEGGPEFCHGDGFFGQEGVGFIEFGCRERGLIEGGLGGFVLGAGGSHGASGEEGQEERKGQEFGVHNLFLPGWMNCC